MPTYQVEIPNQGTFEITSDNDLTDLEVYNYALEQVKSQAPAQTAPSADWMKNLRERDYLDQAPMTARALKAVQGIPLVGGWVQDIASAVSPELEAKVSAVSEAKQSQDPIESAALQMGGSVASSIAAAPVLAPAAFMGWLSKLPTFQKMAVLSGTGGLLGTVEGGVSGAGRGGEGGRLEGAVEGAAIGGAGGLLGGLLPPAVIKGYENLKSSFRNYGPEEIAAALNISVPSAQVIGNTFRDAGGDVKVALQNIFNAGEEGMLADSGVAAQALLDAAQATGGRAAQIGSEEVAGRVSRQGAQLSGVMDANLGALPKSNGVSGDALDLAEGISATTRPARESAYKAAYAQPIDYSSQAGMQVEAVFNSLPQRFKGKAIEKANDKMRLDALKSGMPEPKQIMANIADDGSVFFSEMPNLQQLDQIKQAIGAVAFKDVDSFGRPTADALDAVGWYRQITATLKGASPEYAKAVAAGGDKISLDNALDLGLGMLSPKLTPRDVARALKNADPTDKQYTKLGIRSAINDLIGNAKATIASPDIDINALRIVFGQLSSKNARSKIGLVLGVKQSKQLFKDLDRAQMSLALRAATAINSKTFTRQVAEKQVDDLTDIGAISHLLRLEPAKATQKLTQTITGETDALGVAAKQEIFTDIAKVLTQIKGKEARTALKVIYRASKGQTVSDLELKAVSDLLLNKSGFATIASGSELGQSQVNEG